MNYSDPIASLLGAWSVGLTLGSVLLRVVLSCVLATVIGCERSTKRHSAGLRTFLLIALAATAAMALDEFLNAGRQTPFYLLSAAMIVATGMICVNSLVFNAKNKIKGLTTAAALLGCGLIGLCIGAGAYTVGIVAFLVMLPSLASLTRFETYLKNRSNHFEIHLELKNASFLQDFVTVIRQLGLTIDDIEANPAYAGSGLSVYSVALSIRNDELRKYKTHTEIIEALKSLEYISYIEEM